METVTRRDFNHGMAKFLDRVLETGEPVRVAGRDGRAVVISPEVAESAFEKWMRMGRVRLASEQDGLLRFVPSTPLDAAESALAAFEDER